MKIVALLIYGLILCSYAGAQASASDTILLGAVVERGDTIPMVFLPEVLFSAQMSAEYQAEKAREDKLRNDVVVAYPYALLAGELFKEINVNLEKIPEKRQRKAYLKTMEKRLDKVFKEPLKNLSVEQGRVLIKLVSRQAGQNCFSIIRELKSGFSAVMWESVAIVFGNNLSHEYDPEGKDKDIEKVVKELEASNAYRYQYFQQQARLQARR